MLPSGFDLKKSAREEMIHEGFDPDWSPEALAQASALNGRSGPHADEGVRDLRSLLWSSIDNDASRDLDQIEFAERTPSGIRILVGIADVDADLPNGSPIDQHAGAQTTTVYTAACTFSMLPERLSTDLTSLNENADRLAVVIEMIIDDGGSITSSNIYRALVQNKAQLTYGRVGPWLEGTAAIPPEVSRSAELAPQLKLQDEAARALRNQRHRLGALDFDRVEAHAVIVNGEVKDIETTRSNRASDLIEDFMIAANQVMAQTFTHWGVSSIRRIVKSPERWPRIVELAARKGAALPDQPDSAALAAFLEEQKQKDSAHYADLSLAVVKLMGPGQYVLSRPGDAPQGHFGLAAHDYTHSTAPNRRFADLVVQRLIKSALSGHTCAYADDELSAIAQNCTAREDAARKVERTMSKRAAAVAYYDRRGDTFNAIVTGVTPKDVFVRVTHPPIEGRLVRGEQGVDVGDQILVALVSTDPQRGYIDFAR
ncbi:MAG: RNB domain-containing ribonuclease [Acidobacteriaceae bacterium]|nr:RNB domain-containing ribonuclease [Acidobacteriaceae bacterium]MBV8572233.1 RNB domain-containing ribonuclease [Acidobacteriaceae bacterium]